MSAERPTPEDLETAIGYAFRDRGLLEQAITHKSFAEEARAQSRDTLDNQRLEYLGDAVIGLVIADRLVHHLSQGNEGELSRARAQLVRARSLAGKARSIDLGAHLRLGKGEEGQGGREKDRVLEDALEALVGAVFRDGGFERARQVVGHLFEAELRSLRSGTFEVETSPKSQLQELLQQALQATPTYQDDGFSGPDHLREYQSVALWEERIIGRGRGRKKQDAEKAAARDALDHLAERLPEVAHLLGGEVDPLRG